MATRTRAKKPRPRVPAEIRYHRDVRGWTQQDLADRLREATGEGWPLAKVKRLEGGNLRIDVDMLLALARVFEVPVGELVEGHTASGGGTMRSPNDDDGFLIPERAALADVAA